jgi:hypothetical protein
MNFRSLAKRVAALVMLTVASSISGCGHSLPGENVLFIDHPAMSPDGRMVAFKVCFGWQHCGVGIYDVESGAARLLSNPIGWQMEQPSFSHDARRLVATMQCRENCWERWNENQIAVADLDSGEWRQVTRGPGYRAWPVVRPNSFMILFVSGEIRRGRFQPLASGQCLSLVDLRDGQEREVMCHADRSERLTYIHRPSFTGESSLLFRGHVPVQSIFAEQIKAVGRRVTSEAQAFSLALGEQPQLFYVTGVLGEMCFRLSASRGGERLIFVAHTGTEPRKSGDGRGIANYDVFEASHGRVTQITEFAAPFGVNAHIAYDGSRIAVIAVARPATGSDLFILDTATKELRPTNLRAKLHQLPQVF